VSRIVRHHHERWDGKGYPDGIAGEAIPLGARIFAVADSFDAMTSDRPYRRAMTVENARAEVARCRGTQFDPEIVDAFVRVPVDRLDTIVDDAPHTHSRAHAV
jgi:HD-GYP domain-containing protein (c-di-GMP phosphodiesterase class II)